MLFGLACGLYISFLRIIVLLNRAAGADDSGTDNSGGVNTLIVFSFLPLIISLINL